MMSKSPLSSSSSSTRTTCHQGSRTSSATYCEKLLMGGLKGKETTREKRWACQWAFLLSSGNSYHHITQVQDVWVILAVKSAAQLSSGIVMSDPVIIMLLWPTTSLFQRASLFIPNPAGTFSHAMLLSSFLCFRLPAYSPAACNDLLLGVVPAHVTLTIVSGASV